jgi:AcrR family transcriptional regulator
VVTRTDAARNRAAIIEAARRLLSSAGTVASLEEISRAAGVGSATLHRHFAGRQALLDAVVIEDVRQLCAEAEQVTTAAGPDEALWVWLRRVAVHCAADNALCDLVRGGAASRASQLQSLRMLEEAAEVLGSAAREAGRLRPDVAVSELLTLVSVVANVAAAGSSDVTRLVSLLQHGAQTGPV